MAALTAGVQHFSRAGHGPGEGLTVVVAIPKGVVASPGPILRERWSLQRAFALTPVSAGAAGGLLAVLALLGALALATPTDSLLIQIEPDERVELWALRSRTAMQWAPSCSAFGNTGRWPPSIRSRFPSPLTADGSGGRKLPRAPGWRQRHEQR